VSYLRNHHFSFSYFPTMYFISMCALHAHMESFNLTVRLYFYKGQSIIHINLQLPTLYKIIAIGCRWFTLPVGKIS